MEINGMTLIEAAKQALEALEEAHPKPYNESVISHVEAITALRTAIEAAEKQEPVAWAVFEGWNAHDLYLPQEYDEALKMAGYKGDHAQVKPLYTTPLAQRQWVGLTDEEVREIHRLSFGKDVAISTGLTEAKLKEKHMTTHITKTWFDGEKVVTQEIPESEVYTQEPVAWMDAFGNVFPLGAQRGPKYLNEPMKPLYTTPPAAQRQPLTDEKIDDIWNRYCDEMGEASINDAYDIARAIEAAHGIKEKNT
jgi:hypothetical protein